MKNKIKTVVAVMSCLAGLASCNRIDYNACSSSGGRNEIRFGSNGIRVETKSFVETDNDKLKNDGFNVVAVIDADNSVMFNSAVAYSSDDAVYHVTGGSYYFPAEGTMSFYGVYPVTQSITVEGGEATIVYSQDADMDLVAAEATEIVGQSTAVQMTFDHLLSQVSVNIKGEDASVDYKLKSVKITNADGGIYAFADERWTPDPTTADYIVYSNEAGVAVSTSAMVGIGEAMSFVPGTVSLNVVWECYNKGTEILVSSNDQSVNVTLEKGKHSTLNLTLPSNSSEMLFSTTVGVWAPDKQDIVVKPKEFVFTVNAAGKKVKFSPGNLYWDGSKFCFEAHQYDYPAEWDPNHVGHFYWSTDAAVAVAETYDDSAELSAGDIFFAADGRAITGWTILSGDEWSYLLDKHAAGCNDKFFYHDTIDEGFSVVGIYADAEKEYNENFAYLKETFGSFSEIIASGDIVEDKFYPHIVAGNKCLILTPDGFDGNVYDSYTALEWAEAEKEGLVAIPYAGKRKGAQMVGVGVGNYYPGTLMYAEMCDKIELEDCYIIHMSTTRKECNSVRLVQVVE